MSASKASSIDEFSALAEPGCAPRRRPTGAQLRFQSQKACLYDIRANLQKHPGRIKWSSDTRVLTNLAEIDTAGHRFVHRGPHFEDPVMITSGVREGIASVSAFAPLHIRSELEGMRLGKEQRLLRLQAAIGAMAAVLGGMDAPVFTAGAGENSPDVRAAACAPLEFLGLKLDIAKNARPTLDEMFGR